MNSSKTPVPVVENPDLLADHFVAFDELVRILRAECPWDRKQTHASISHLLIEESYETLEAIEKGDDEEFSKELGDLLLHVVMHSVMAEERGAFSLRTVIEKVFAKLVHRHPHVFGDTAVSGEDEVLQNWEALKMKEGRTSTLEGVPKHLPALLRAQRIQEKAANVGFDWDKKEDVWAKVEEEFTELRVEIAANNPEKSKEEFGDFMFALVNAARFEKFIAEDAVQATNQKFTKRFQYIEQKASEQGRRMNDMTLAEMDEIWNEAKKLER